MALIQRKAVGRQVHHFALAGSRCRFSSELPKNSIWNVEEGVVTMAALAAGHPSEAQFAEQVRQMPSPKPENACSRTELPLPHTLLHDPLILH